MVFSLQTTTAFFMTNFIICVLQRLAQNQDVRSGEIPKRGETLPDLNVRIRYWEDSLSATVGNILGSGLIWGAFGNYISRIDPDKALVMVTIYFSTYVFLRSIYIRKNARPSWVSIDSKVTSGGMLRLIYLSLTVGICLVVSWMTPWMQETKSLLTALFTAGILIWIVTLFIDFIQFAQRRTEYQPK